MRNPPHAAFWFLRWGAFLCAMVIVSVDAKADDAGGFDAYPFEKGAIRTYAGEAQDTLAGGEIVRRRVVIKIEVVDVVQRDGIKAAFVLGDFGDASLENPANRTRHIIIKSGAGLYFDCPYGDSKVWEGLHDKTDALVNLLGNSRDPILDLPLLQGKVLGDHEQGTRSDHMYCWYVRDSAPADLRGVSGIRAPHSSTEYVLEYMTNPDAITQRFVPGVGIVRYHYSHHGTTMELDLKLISISYPPHASGGNTPKMR